MEREIFPPFFLLVIDMKRLTFNKDEDYYKILGVSKTASKKDIKKAYRRLSKLYHPDAGGHDAAMFIKLTEAYNILFDDEKRFLYDTIGFSQPELEEAAKMMVHFVMEGVLKGLRYKSQIKAHVLNICQEHTAEIDKLNVQLESAIKSMTLTLNELVGKNEDVFNQLFRKTIEGFILSNQLEKENKAKMRKMYDAIRILLDHIDFTKEQPQAWWGTSNSSVGTAGTGSFTIRFG